MAFETKEEAFEQGRQDITRIVRDTLTFDAKPLEDRATVNALNQNLFLRFAFRQNAGNTVDIDEQIQNVFGSDIKFKESPLATGSFDIQNADEGDYKKSAQIAGRLYEVRQMRTDLQGLQERELTGLLSVDEWEKGRVLFDQFLNDLEKGVSEANYNCNVLGARSALELRTVAAYPLLDSQFHGAEKYSYCSGYNRHYGSSVVLEC